MIFFVDLIGYNSSNWSEQVNKTIEIVESSHKKAKLKAQQYCKSETRKGDYDWHIINIKEKK